MVGLGEIGQNFKAPTAPWPPLAVALRGLTVWSRTASGGALIPPKTFSLGSLRCSLPSTAAPQSATFEPAAGGESRQGSGSPLCRALLAPVGFLSSPKFPSPSWETSWHRVADGKRWTEAAGVTMWIGIHSWYKIWNKYVIIHMFSTVCSSSCFLAQPSPPLPLRPLSLPFKPGKGWLIIMHDLSYSACFSQSGSVHFIIICCCHFTHWITHTSSVFYNLMLRLCCFDDMRQHYKRGAQNILHYKWRRQNYSKSVKCPLIPLQV